jgi:hypothetical protein
LVIIISAESQMRLALSSAMRSQTMRRINHSSRASFRLSIQPAAVSSLIAAEISFEGRKFIPKSDGAPQDAYVLHRLFGPNSSAFAIGGSPGLERPPHCRQEHCPLLSIGMIGSVEAKAITANGVAGYGTHHTGARSCPIDWRRPFSRIKIVIRHTSFLRGS